MLFMFMTNNEIKTINYVGNNEPPPFILLGLAVMQSRRCAQTRTLVEQRFGHPLSAEGLEEYYRRQGTIDGDFWKRLKECMEQLPDTLSIGGK